MAKSNPSNPATIDEGVVQQSVPMAVSKARVERARSHPTEGGFHTARIKVYGDEAPYDAPVLPLTIGSVWIPKEGMDVMVMFRDSNMPVIIGPWYAVDAVQAGDIDIPEYEPGEVVIGNGSGGHIRIDNDGNVHLNASDSGDVYINGTVQ